MSLNKILCFSCLHCFFTIFFLPSSSAQPSPAIANQTCLNYQFPNGASFASCQDLHLLNSFVHWTFHPSSCTLDLAFRMTQTASNRWIAWAINPTSKGMVSSQAFIAYQQSDGTTKAYTSSISSYSTRMHVSNLSFPVSQLSAIYSNTNREMIIFAEFNLPSNNTIVNHVWQEGPVKSGDMLGAHPMSGPNLRSFSTIDFSSGKTTDVIVVNTVGGSRISLGNNYLLKVIHGVLNTIGWGVLMPMGIILPILKKFPCMNPTLWFKLHITCQLLGYLVGVSGGLIGVVLGLKKKQVSSFGAAHPTHAYIGILLLVLATLQVLVGAFMRPKKDQKKRIYWNMFHWIVGYSTVGLGFYNVLGGLNMLDVANWIKTAYIGFLSFLAVVFLIFQVWRFVKIAFACRTLVDAKVVGAKEAADANGFSNYVDEIV